MGYLHIENLYKNQTIMLFKECYAAEKVHGTSAHINFKRHDMHNVYDPVTVTFFSGGEKHDNFVKLFDQPALEAAFKATGHEELTIYGEAYGGKCQGMSATYGKELAFIAFDVRVGKSWLNMDAAEAVCVEFGIEFVPYIKIPTTLEAIDRERDAFSLVAERRGCGADKLREGVVLRPLIEMTLNNGERIIVKHKRAEFAETKTPRVVDASQMQVLQEAQAIADEWVTVERLNHVINRVAADKQKDVGLINVGETGDIIKYMIEDVTREAAGEIVDSKDARKAIGSAAAKLFKQFVENRMRAAQ